MFIETKEDLYIDDEKYLDEVSFFDEVDDREFSIEEEEAADNLFNFLQGIIDNNDSDISEEFVSETCARLHFRRHCLRNRNLKSDRSSVFYDFNNFPDYLNHEDVVSKKTSSSSAMHIRELLDVKIIISAFRKLFEGDKCIVFDLGCGFHNTTGKVRLCINSYATDYTKNYLYNTVDFLIQAPNDKTISLYPLDANYLETKINNEIRKIPEAIALKINH